MHKGKYTVNEKCRACKSTRLHKFLDLGLFPAVNNMPSSPNEDEPHYPLEVYFCEDCNLVQLIHIVPPEVLFGHYVYLTSTSSTMKQHLTVMTGNIYERFLKGKSALAMDIGSNDGTLLSTYPKEVKVLGIEPASNVAEIANKNGVPTVAEFFGRESAKRITEQHGQADVITATNVFAHINDWDSVISGVGELMKDGGVFVIEAPYLIDFLEKTEFDTIYHEHLSYISLRPLIKLFNRFGMEVFDVLRTPIHGGSIRIFVARAGRHEVKDSVASLVEEEQRRGLGSFETYLEFTQRVEKLRENLTSLLSDLKKQRRRIIGYGAAAKGTVLLNYLGIGTDTIDYVVDKNPLKQNRYVPGTRIPVYGPDKILKERPDYMLILVWNIAEEVMKEQEAYARAGGRFILPIPEPKIV